LRVAHSIVALWPGTDSQVFLWSSAYAGVPIGALVEQRGETTGCVSDTFVTPISRLSKANDASQFGIGVVAARIAQLVLRDERAVVPIGSYNKDFGVTLSLPSVVGRADVIRSFEPEMSGEERLASEASAANLKTIEEPGLESLVRFASAH
jgi:L-lactate dehydrogenase